MNPICQSEVGSSNSADATLCGKPENVPKAGGPDVIPNPVPAPDPQQPAPDPDPEPAPAPPMPEPQPA